MVRMRQGTIVTDNSLLADLGWQPFFQQQLTLEELEQLTPARVVEQHRSIFELATADRSISLPVTPTLPSLTVGDWVLLDQADKFVRRLDRKSCFKRKAAGSQLAEQLIAANIDNAFIVCSLNDDFNLSRIERYLAMVKEAGVTPVIVLSKADLCDDPGARCAEVQALDPLLCVEPVNCLDRTSIGAVLPWCRAGETLVMLGSSGSGKSTLSNALLGANIQDTGSIREDDSKGRHTTTRRSLLQMPGGAMILDTPGMRELQLTDCEQGIELAFADISALASGCRFNDCQHETEPGCAVQQAIENGDLEERRLNNYRKLLREQAHNSASFAQQRARGREFAKHVKQVHHDRKRMLEE
jgi:ribosome biogenesis GTPase